MMIMVFGGSKVLVSGFWFQEPTFLIAIMVVVAWDKETSAFSILLYAETRQVRKIHLFYLASFADSTVSILYAE